uniref:Uncharacterized protein n=1 Tax=Solanum tuberosum TaxID=4113 RepID=M1B9Z2_SOLTU
MCNGNHPSRVNNDEEDYHTTKEPNSILEFPESSSVLLKRRYNTGQNRLMSSWNP